MSLVGSGRSASKLSLRTTQSLRVCSMSSLECSLVDSVELGSEEQVADELGG